MGKILVTSALPYANGSIHLGHMVEYIQTDIYVRFLKLIGEDAVYICADDTHGTPIEISAKKQGILPEQLIDKYHKEHLQDFTDFHIKFDSYYSTNSEENKKFAELIFNKLNEKGLIYTKEVEQSYCEKCKRFLPDRFLKGKCPKCNEPDQYGDVCEKCNATYSTIDLVDPYCTLCGGTPVRKTSKHYFFKLSSLSDKLKKYIEDQNFQPEIKNFLMNWIKEGLQDWCISRDGPYFGFLIPSETDKYFYVWLDAPIGYISSTENYCKNNKSAKCDVLDYWQNDESKIIHVIGKDIIYFHFLFWPAMLMESGFNLPDDIMVHGFLTVNGEKMSKSKGTFFTARDYLNNYDPNYIRYYFATHLSRKMQDVDLDFQDFKDAVNNRLISNFGNYCFRVISFTNKNNNGETKSIDDGDECNKIIKNIEEKIPLIKKSYENFDFKNAIKEIMAISDIGNKYFQDKEPWKIQCKEELDKILGLCLNIVKILSIVAYPVLPEVCERLRKQLDVEVGWEDINFKTKFDLEKAEPLFEKIEKIPEKEKFLLNLKVAKVLEVKDHPEADKLYVIKIDLGNEKKQIVAGMKPYYSKEELLGRNIIVVTNLEQAKLRGIVSQGMLLASGESAKLLSASKSKPGDQVGCGIDNNNGIISIKDFAKIKLTVKNHKVYYNEKVLKTKTEEISTEAEDGAKIK